jgi:hypothetical protein
MTNPDRLNSLIERIITHQHTEKDLTILRQLLIDGDRKISTQLGKYNVNIGEGKEIHIGDRTYNQWDEKSIEALVKQIQKNSGIHQDTRGGDAAGRDIDKRNIYNDCTFIQLVVKDSNVSSFDLESFRYLEYSGIPQESIQQAYQDSLTSDAGLWDLAENDLMQRLQALEQFRRLPEFLDRLSRDKNVPLEVREHLIAKYLVSKKYPGRQNNTSEENSFSDRQVQLKSYLIATLVPGDRDGDRFLLNAWLIIDDSVKDLSKFQSLLDLDEQQTGTICKLTQVSAELNKFIKKALKCLRGKRHSLIIEVFLPSDLMCMEIDRWKITDTIADEITLGIQYPIRLRSLERLDLDYLDSYLSQWYECWDKVRNILPHKPTKDFFERLEVIDSFNWKVLRSKLKERIGLKVTCPHPQSMRKDLFRAILQATTPIAIWIRNDIPNVDRVTAIDEVLTFQPLCHLCESVRQTREKADSQSEEHLGLHLALLWENPYRLTPDLMVELIAPGK